MRVRPLHGIQANGIAEIHSGLLDCPGFGNVTRLSRKPYKCLILSYYCVRQSAAQQGTNPAAAGF
jgi:hypothetical protein